jgi:hypothetical protein
VRLAQIDVLKGLAIAAMLLLLGLPRAAPTDGAAVFYIGARNGGSRSVRWSEGVEQAEERPQPLVVGEDAPPHAPAGGDDLGGDLDECCEDCLRATP